AQPPHAVALLVPRAHFRGGIVGVKQSALLDGEQKDDAVDEPQELLEKAILGERTLVQRLAQRLVLRDEAAPELEQRLLHAAAQIRTRAGALLQPFLAPLLQRTVVGWRPRHSEARLVQQQPQGREVRVPLLCEDARE